jgi:superfamily II DNA or RNA helicase
MPCGTGKTLTSVWIAQRLQGELLLVLVPTLALLRQTVRTWQGELDGFQVLKVCSDKARGSERELVAADPSLLELGGDTTTDPQAIECFLGVSGRRLVIGTYASSPQIAKAMSEAPEDVRFDLVVCDEAHHCAGIETGAHRTVLDDARIRARRRLFVTATPTVFSASAKDQAAHTHTRVASMDDHSRFGHVLHRLSFKQAVEEGLVCDYQVVVMPVHDADVVDLVKRRRLVTHSNDRITDAYSLAAEIACLRAMREHGCRRMVTFHPGVDEARKFAADIVDASQLLPDSERPGRVEGRAIDGYMKRPKQEAILGWFGPDDDGAKLLTNVRLLAEGVDAPEIDGICFIDTRRSAASIVQAVGRAVRTAPGKTLGTIVVPVVVRDGEDVRDALARSEHRNVLEVLAALRSLDSEIRNTVDYIRVELGPRSAGAGPGRWVIDAPLEVDERFAEAIEISLVDLLGAKSSKARSASDDDDDGVSIFRPIGSRRKPDDDPLDLQTGLDRLRSHHDSHYSGVLNEHTLELGFQLGKWWGRVMKLWAADQLSDDVKQECAEVVNWIPIKGHRKVRTELADLDPVPLADRLDDYLGWRYGVEDRELRGFIERKLIGRFEATVRPSWALQFVDQKQSKVRQARHTIVLLRRVGRAMDEGVEFREEVARGFADAMRNPGRGHDLDVDIKAGQGPRSAIEAHACGWEAGQEAWRRLHRPKGRRQGRGQGSRRRRSDRGDGESRRAA